MSDPGLSAIVLAAGHGTRMHSSRPKPLHMLCGKPMVVYVLDALAAADLDHLVVVVGHGAEQVTKKLHEHAPDLALDFVEQRLQRGTGDAAAVGLTGLADDDLNDGDVLVLPGDTPLLRGDTIGELVRTHRSSGAACTVLTARVPDPSGYGRILRSPDGGVAGIVEESDATAEQRQTDEINTGIYCFRSGLLPPALRRITPDNVQGEFYLTDVVSVLLAAGHAVASALAADAGETIGVNDRVQLADAEAALRRRTNHGWLHRGVSMVDPDRTYIDTTVVLAADVSIFPGTILQGRTVVGEGAEIGPDTRLVDCAVGARARVEKTMARDAEVGAGAHVGPFAVLHPGAQVDSDSVTGPFYTATNSEHLGGSDAN
jgi:bifunctional UDP-N-acetylglucosamine pyrophosphorylase/glucosamine-1-phosphate N-acetyltransferase